MPSTPRRADALRRTAASAGAAASSVVSVLLGLSLASNANATIGLTSLTSWVLASAALALALACLYLCVIWALAVIVQLGGPASRSSRIAFRALAVLAPRLARKVGLGMITATTALVLSPPLSATPTATPPFMSEGPVPAAVGRLAGYNTEPLSPGSPGLDTQQYGSQPDVDTGTPGVGRLGMGSVPQPMETTDLPGLGWGSPEPQPLPPHGWGQGNPADDAADLPPLGWGSGEPTDAAEDLPPLGWGSPQKEHTAAAAQGELSPASSMTTSPSPSAAPSPSSSPAASAASRGEASRAHTSESAPRTHTVREGETLWGITDDLLGPGRDNPEAIARCWPILHRANGPVIGADPDLIYPGQLLEVPPTLHGDPSCATSGNAAGPGLSSSP